MAGLAAKLMSGLTCAVALFTAGQAAAAQSETTALVLYVDNYAGVPPSLLIGAEKEAQRIYAAAGLRTFWVNDERDPGKVRLGRVRYLRVLRLCPKMSARKISADEVPDNVLAQAGHSTGRAYIFIHRVMDAAARLESHPEIVLGRVLAHEVGHLLLPRPGHAQKGLMKSGLDFRSRAADTFTATERAAIKLALAVRPRT